MESLTRPPQPTAAQRRFIHDAWYAAAWADELTSGLLARTILNLPLVLFRQQNGDVAALLDICPHKFAPLSLGRRVGDAIQCGYHGLEFDGKGKCVRNPHGNRKVPPGAKVATYPAVERHGMLWVWMGTSAPADPEIIPDFGFLTGPDWRAVCGRSLVRGNYELSVDNLMDLGHALYLHRASAGDFGDVRPQHEVTQEGLRVRDMRLYPATPLPAGMARQYNLTPGELKDISTDIEWSPVGLIQNNICVAPVGQARVTGLMSRGVHCLTPETETSTHYFYANVRNYMIHDERIDELFREWQSNALQGEDGAMVEAIQRNLDAAERCSIAPVFLSTDAAPSRVRRVLATLLADEAAPSDIGLVEQASGGGRHP